MLARGGVPCFLLWLLVQGTCVIAHDPRLLPKRRTRRPAKWSAVFLFIGAYWLAFMTNATFDVFLEGPMGGIWFWTVLRRRARGRADLS
jgi:hypothetical protein